MRGRRVVVSVPMLVALVLGGSPALAADDELDLRLDQRSQRAAPGADQPRPDQFRTDHFRADTFEEGVVRRTARLTDVEHTDGNTNPSRQLAAVDVTVDLTAQTFSATATLNGPPDPEAPALIAVGTWDGNTCRTAFIAGAAPGSAAAQFADGTPVTATPTVSGNQIGLVTAAHPALRSTEFECAFAVVTDNAQPTANILSRAYADDLVETYQPILEVEAEQKIVGAKKGKWANLDVEVRNSSRGDAGGVRLTASGKGIEVKQRSVEIGPLENRSTEYLDLQVRLVQPKGKKQKTPKPRTLTLTVTDPAAATATASVSVVVTPKPTTPKKVAGTYWWGWEATNLQSSAGWINHSVWFVDRKWAYTGWAEGKKPRCSAKVKECQRYSYNARTGKLRIGKQKAKVTSEGFTFKHPAYGEKLHLEPLTLPKKGAKLGVDLFHQNWSGVCAITCTSYTDYLTMDTAGRFVEGGFSVGSWPGLGSSWSIVPPDERGTYKIVGTGIIEMSYADGTRKREVIGIQHDPAGRPNPALAGVLIGSQNFYE